MYQCAANHHMQKKQPYRCNTPNKQATYVTWFETWHSSGRPQILGKRSSSHQVFGSRSSFQLEPRVPASFATQPYKEAVIDTGEAASTTSLAIGPAHIRLTTFTHPKESRGRIQAQEIESGFSSPLGLVPLVHYKWEICTSSSIYPKRRVCSPLAPPAPSPRRSNASEKVGTRLSCTPNLDLVCEFPAKQ